MRVKGLVHSLTPNQTMAISINYKMVSLVLIFFLREKLVLINQQHTHTHICIYSIKSKQQEREKAMCVEYEQLRNRYRYLCPIKCKELFTECMRVETYFLKFSFKSHELISPVPCGPPQRSHATHPQTLVFSFFYISNPL